MPRFRRHHIYWTFSVAIVTLLAATRYNPTWLFADWQSNADVPFRVRETLEIATRWKPFKRSSLTLICARDGVHLRLKSLLPIPDREYPVADRPFRFVSFTAVGSFHDHFETRSFGEYGHLDVVVTAPLSNEQQKQVLSWLKPGASARISFSVSETSTHLSPSAYRDDAVAFLARCRSTAQLGAGLIGI